MTPTGPAIPIPERSLSLGTADPATILLYGCVKCQRHHYEGTPLFAPHLYYQSKHGVQSMSRAAYFACVAPTN